MPERSGTYGLQSVGLYEKLLGDYPDVVTCFDMDTDMS